EHQPYADDASPTAESPRYIADLKSMEEDYIDYPDEPEIHTDYPADGEDVDEASDDDNDDDDTNDEDEVRKTVRLEPPIPASMEVRIAEHAVVPIPSTSPTYDQAPLGHRAAMIHMRDYFAEMEQRVLLLLLLEHIE
ncbi:hypothetical protein Tco_0203922, partial [Tanacetum coccineum]